MKCRLNKLLDTDTQHRAAAPRQVLRAGQRQRWASLPALK
jgi:hypothetical protein